MTNFPDDKRRLLILSLGTHNVSRPLSPDEVCDYLIEWMETGETLHSISRQVQLRGPGMLKKFLRLKNLAPDLKPLVEWGKPTSGLNFSAASEIASEPNFARQVELGKAAVANKLNAKEIQSILQRVRRGGVSVETAIKEIVQLRPKIEQRYVYIGQLRDDIIEKLKDTLHSDRDAVLKSAVVKMLGGYDSFGARLGAGRWTLVGGRDLEDRLASHGARLNSEVNNAIASTLKLL